MTPPHTISWQPTLVGSLITLRPLTADDFDAVYAAASDPLIWAQHPEPTRWQRDVFTRYFDSAIAGAAAVVVHDASTQAVIGCSRWYEWDASTRDIAIGYTFLARSHWGGAVNGELKRLMLDHAFQFVDRVWFHVGARNHRSRAALGKIGAQLDRIELADAARGGQDTAYFVMRRS
jgi:RimJ/RimL family protein N-acetyltransferase